MVFIPAPGIDIEDGLQALQTKMAYNKKAPLDSVNRPHFYISDRCQNIIQALQEYTAEGGTDEAWKDPVGERWREVMRMFPNAEIVSYKTPFDTLVRKLSRCKVFISYHGSCAWVARHLRVPMVIFSSNRKLSDPCFPCAIQSDISVLSNLDPLIEDSKHRTLSFDRDLSQYEYRPTVLGRIQTC